MSALITQLVSDEPTIVAVGSGQPLENELWTELRRAGTEVTVASLNAVIQQPESLKAKLEDSYKIVCCIKPISLNHAELHAIIRALEPHQKKTVLVVLVDSAIQLSVHEPDVMTQWRVASDAQETAIRVLSKELERVRILFCQDVCQEGKREYLPAYSCLVTDPVEFVDPQVLVAPVGTAELVAALAQQLVLPLPQPSVLFRGNAISTSELLQTVVQALKHVSLRTIAIRPIAGTIRPILPFSVQEQALPNSGVTPRLAEWLAALVPALPQPKPIATKNPVLLERAQRQALQVAPIVPPPDIPPRTSEQSQPRITQPEQPPISQDKAAETLVTQAMLHTPLRKTPIKPQELDVSAELQKIFTPERVTETVTRVVTIAKTEKTTKIKGKRKRLLFSGGLVAIAVGLVLFAMAGIYATSVTALKHSLEDTLSQPQLLQYSDSAEVQKESSELHLPSPTLTKFVAVQVSLYGGIFETPLTAHAQQYVEIASILPQAATELETTQKATKSLYSFVMGNELGDVDQLSKQLTTAAQNSYEQLSKLQAVLKTVDLEVVPAPEPSSEAGTPEAENTTNKFEQSLAMLRKTLVVQQQLHSILPQLLGEPTKRTYAVVFQNSQELRPTGGFIQSVALLTFANGSLVSTEVMSSYDLDRKLPGSVQPPEEVQKYLGEKQWFLRDSNWDPHFPNTANKIAWFIDRTHGVQVDGVLAFNLESLRPILAALGPIDVPEYNEVITHKNIQERMEFHSEVVLAPEASERDYSTVLLEKILAKAVAVPDAAVIPFLSAVQEVIAAQEVSLALFDKTEASLVDSIGWSGGLVRPNCPVQLEQTNCVVDYLYPVEANVGVNKANAYIARSVVHEVSFESTATLHSHILRLENTAKSNSWPKGPYKSYIRFYLPAGSTVSAVQLNGQTIPATLLNQYDDQGLRVLGVEVSVPIQQQAELQIEYRSAGTTSDAFAYAFFLQKQPGVGDTPTLVRVTIPAGKQAKRVAPAATVSQDVVEFSLKQSEHAFVGVEFE